MKKQLLTPIIALCMFIAGNSCFAQWTQTSFSVPVGTTFGYVYSIGTTVYAGSQYYGVFVSNDDGGSWNASNTGLTPANGIGPMALSGGTLVAGTSTSAVRSSDNGATWTTTTMPHGVNALIASGGNFYAGSYAYGVYISTDNGATWTATATGMAGAYCLHANGGAIFCGTGAGIYKTTDNGATWTITTMPAVQVNTITSIGSTIFAGTQASGVYKSTDNGATWTTANTGLSFYALYVYSLYAVGSNLFAGTGYAVYLSTDNGATWSDVNTGLPILSDNVMSFTSNGTYLFGSTSDRHVVRRLLSEMITTGINDMENTIDVSVYPNPAIEKVIVELSFDPENSVAKIFSIDGKLVQQNCLQDSRAELMINELPKGIYFIKVESPAGVAVKKIIKE